MSIAQEKFTGRWLHHGDWHGKEFSHELAEYEHDESPGATGATPMRHAHLEREGKQVGVWVPASWSDDQAREALESNW
jgi:hypothetical protein